jgi:hypothetical protein
VKTVDVGSYRKIPVRLFGAGSNEFYIGTIEIIESGEM